MALALSRPRPRFDALLSLAVLLWLVIYTGAYLQSPYVGFRFDNSGHVTEVMEAAPATPGLHIADRLVQVGNVTWTAYKEQRRAFFTGARPGQTVAIVVERDGQQVTVPWVMPAIRMAEIIGRIVNLWLLGFAFWLAGTLALLVVRPRDLRWGLFVAFNFVTAVWLVAGTLSSSRLLGSGQVLRAAIWLSVPIYLHLHWLFPRPLRRLPRPIPALLYAAGLGLAAAELFSRVPADAYFVGFLLASLGSLLLLGLRYLTRRAERPELRLVVIAAALAIAPAAGLGLVGLGGGVNSTMSGAIVGLPLLPFTYLYIIHRRRLGGLELRVNRAISFYIFLIGLLTGAALVSAFAVQALALPGALVSTLVAGLATAAAVFGFGRFQGWVERRVLRVPAAPEHLLATYAAATAASLDRAALASVLQAQVLGPLLIEQAVLLLDDGAPALTVLRAARAPAGVTDLPTRADLPALLAVAGQYRPDPAPDQPGAWARLVLPLVVGERLAGVWLLGRRAPDDYYAQAEVEVLGAIAHQTALALSHIDQTERLRRLYQANISQREAERQRVARELHDVVLGELAVVIQRLADEPVLESVITGLQAGAGRLRQMIEDLRPATLDYSLWLALAHLADTVGANGHAPAGLEVQFEVTRSEARYDEAVEHQLYRIVQQAVDNVRAHAQARTVRIGGALLPERVEVWVEDDGVGLGLDPALSLDQHLAALVHGRHYGLAGMAERAHLIGAELGLGASPGQGTAVRVVWPAKAIQPPAAPPDAAVE